MSGLRFVLVLWPLTLVALVGTCAAIVAYVFGRASELSGDIMDRMLRWSDD